MSTRRLVLTSTLLSSCTFLLISKSGTSSRGKRLLPKLLGRTNSIEHIHFSKQDPMFQHYCASEDVDENSLEARERAIEAKYTNFSHDGEYLPEDPTSHVAIIIPVRNREMHLHYFMRTLPLLLIKQKIHFRIYAVYQEDTHDFNRGALINIGYLQAKEDYPWQCYVFHDVDRIPKSTRISYRCATTKVDGKTIAQHYTRIGGPVHSLSGYTGGVVQMPGELIEKVNGFGNYFYGWGGEDKDFYHRTSWFDWPIFQATNGRDIDSYINCDKVANGAEKKRTGKKDSRKHDPAGYLALNMLEHERFDEGDGLTNIQVVLEKKTVVRDRYLTKVLATLTGTKYTSENFEQLMKNPGEYSTNKIRREQRKKERQRRTKKKNKRLYKSIGDVLILN